MKTVFKRFHKSFLFRFTTNEQARSSTGGSGRGGGGGGGSDTAVLINAALEHNNRLEVSATATL